MSRNVSSCHHVVSTSLGVNASSLLASALSSYGILFTISNPSPNAANNNVEKDHETVITSLGFNVDMEVLSSYFNTSDLISSSAQISYQVFTMVGYYADTNRRGGGSPVNSTWDYRGDFSHWTLVADGAFGMEDLGPNLLVDSNEITNISDMVKYFQIPWDTFQPTVLAEQEVQSFYVTLVEVGALLYYPLETWESLNDYQTLMDCGLTIDSSSDEFSSYGGSLSDCVDYKGRNYHLPALQIGEGVVSYPFYKLSYFYTPRKYIGSIYFEVYDNCTPSSPQIAPSVSPRTMGSLVPHSYTPTLIVDNFTNLFSSTVPLTDLSSPPTLDLFNAGQYGCHRSISTDESIIDFINQTTSSYGMIFSIQTNKDDDDGLWITSLAFHVNFTMMTPQYTSFKKQSLRYETYTLLENGFYADSNRSKDGIPQEFDYRGNFSFWKPIANGIISSNILSYFNHSNNHDDRIGFFQIPWNRFEPTFISPNGGIQSFYLTLNYGSLIFKELERRQSIGEVQKHDDYKSNFDHDSDHHPILFIGEGVIGYPFYNLPFIYIPQQFVGKIFYEYECPSEMPSAMPSALPTHSLSPSYTSTERPSSHPSSIIIPSLQPTENLSMSTQNSDTSASVTLLLNLNALVLYPFIGLILS